MRSWYFFFGIALIGSCLAAPLDHQVEVDPELSAGYFQGDIVLDELRTGLINKTRRWPNNIVYYRFLTEFDAEHHNHILRGMQIIEDVSCIRFKEASSDQTDFVGITGNNGGCFSSVGYLGRQQSYNLQIYPLDTGCFRLGTVVHEFLHTLGFYHMQSASDRDDYVKIVYENIQAGTEGNFNKYDDTVIDAFDEEYDYGSVMHYPATAFSVNGEHTIIPLKDEQAWEIMGQRRGMSQSDINRLNTMYRCPLKS